MTLGKILLILFCASAVVLFFLPAGVVAFCQSKRHEEQEEQDPLD